MNRLYCLLLNLLLIGLPAIVQAEDIDDLLRHLESVPLAETHIYGLRDSQRSGMDCLKVFQPIDAPGADVYYGVYHNYQKRVLTTHLARSTDLRTWNHLTVLDQHASQPTVFPCGQGGYLLAYEHDEPDSVWIRIRYYKNLSDLCEGKYHRQYDVARSLAPSAEGTPSFESVTLLGNDVDQSEIHIRFHYYQNRDVDQLARGTLLRFEKWQATPDRELNAELIGQGWRGNLGDRDGFTWQGKRFYLQEVQREKGKWESWRICLCDQQGAPLRTLAIKTHGGSTAFANPNVTWVTDGMNRRRLVVTLFLLSEGNPAAEAGTLLYVIDPSDNPESPTE